MERSHDCFRGMLDHQTHFCSCEPDLLVSLPTCFCSKNTKLFTAEHTSGMIQATSMQADFGLLSYRSSYPQ